MDLEGWQLERFAGAVATRLGYGPEAMALRTLRPINHQFHRCPRHDGESGAASAYHVAKRSAPPSAAQKCIYYCIGCKNAFYEELGNVPGFKKRMKRLLNDVQAADICTQLTALEWIRAIPASHSSMRDQLAELGAVVVLHTLRMSLDLSTSEEHHLLKRAVNLALEVLEDEYTSRVFEELFSLDHKASLGDRKRFAYRAAAITRSSTGEMPYSAFPRIAYRWWWYPQDYAPFLGLTACFPSRDVITSALHRMDAAIPGTWERTDFETFFESLLSWLANAAEERYTDWWICAARDVWVPLLIWRCTSEHIPKLRYWRELFPDGCYRQSLPPIPLQEHTALLWQGHYICSTGHKSDIVWLPTYEQLIWSVVFEHHGFLNDAMIAWLYAVTEAIDTEWC